MTHHYEANPFEDEHVAQEWAASVENETVRMRELELYPHLQTWRNTFKANVIIEPGCGQGVVSDHINLEPGQTYFGSDPSVPLIQRAKQLYPQANRLFVVSNIYALPYETHQADAVLCVNVWFHLKDILSATNELARILKPKGHWLISTVNPNLYNVWQSFYSDVVQHSDHVMGRVQTAGGMISSNTFYPHTWTAVQAACQAAGLVINHTHTFGHPDPEHPQGEGLFISLYGTKL